MKIKSLTSEQEAELPIFRQRYLDIATTGERADRPALEAALADAYAEIGKPAPKLFLFDSPAECLLAIKIFDMGGDDLKSLWANLGANLRDNLGANLWANLGNNLGDNLGANLWANLGNNLGANLRDNLRANLGDNLGNNLGANLRDNLRANLWANLWANLGNNLWANLRANLRANLWDNLRDNLGDNLRDNLGANLWDNLGDNLWDKNIWNGNFLWGSQDLYWIAWARFAEKIDCKFAEQDARRLDIMERIAFQCEWWWPFENIVIASQRPFVKWDDEGRIHCETGLAVEYRGGYGLSFWHGQVIPNEWVAGSPLSPAEALHWENMDQRAAACEIVGWHNILDQLQAKIIDDSGDPMWGKLVEVNLPDSGKERFLDAICGTNRRFALPVPPSTKTVDEAQSVLHGGLPAEILKFCHERT